MSDDEFEPVGPTRAQIKSALKSLKKFQPNMVYDSEGGFFQFENLPENSAPIILEALEKLGITKEAIDVNEDKKLITIVWPEHALRVASILEKNGFNYKGLTNAEPPSEAAPVTIAQCEEAYNNAVAAIQSMPFANATNYGKSSQIYAASVQSFINRNKEILNGLAETDKMTTDGSIGALQVGDIDALSVLQRKFISSMQTTTAAAATYKERYAKEVDDVSRYTAESVLMTQFGLGLERQKFEVLPVSLGLSQYIKIGTGSWAHGHN